jgi:apyrase
LGLHYGFEFPERLIAPVSPPVPDKPPVAPPEQSLACNTVKARYGLIIDAGSSGSRIYIYCWKPAEANGIPWVAAPAQQGERPWMETVDYKLSDVSSDSDADKSLEPLTEYAREKIGDALGQTRLHLMATGGMRRKSDADQDKTLDYVRKHLEKKFGSASTVTSTVISGKKEALYGWIAVNYLMGFLKEKDGNLSPTMGILELGGASTQIAFASSDVPPQVRLGSKDEGLATLQWGKTAYQIYVRSLPDWGQDEALKKIDKAHKSACYPKEYDEDPGLGNGTGDYVRCRDEIIKMMGDLPSPSVKQDPNSVFLAYSAYYHTYWFLNREPFFSLMKLETAGNQYCREDWHQLTKKYDIAKKYLSQYCFTAAYIAALLQTGYGFPAETRQIIITNTLHGNEISWTLGAMITEAGAKFTLEEK